MKAKRKRGILIAGESIIVTIIGMCLYSALMSFMRKIGINILSSSYKCINDTINNILFDIVIILSQIIVLKANKIDNIFNELKLKIKNRPCRLFFKGMTIGVILIFISDLFIFVTRIWFYSQSGFTYYGFVEVIVFILSLLIRTITVAISEEIFFRGVLLNNFEKYTNRKLGLIICSFIFMIFHCMVYQTIYQLTAVFILGLILGILYIKTESLYTSIGMHFAVDFCSGLIAPAGEVSLLVCEINEKYNYNILEKNMFISLTIAGSIILGLLYIKYVHKPKISK